jgi:hypothetical protein
MWYLLVSLYLPINDIGFTYRFDEWGSQWACEKAKAKLLDHRIELLKRTGKGSYITKIECKEAENV